MLSKILKQFNNNIKRFNFSTAYKTQPRIKPPKLKFIEPIGWFLLIVPASTFALGTWQIYRKQWKEQLLTDLQTKTNSDPVKLPYNFDEIQQLEYKPVYVRGKFLHDKEMYLGPRSLLRHGDASTKSSLVSETASKSQGYLVVTPFKLADRDQVILINRGWVPVKQRDPRARIKGQVDEEVDVVGIVRLHENRPNFGLRNQEGSNIYFYRDLTKMSQVANSDPIYLDATNDFDIPGGPIGGQTRVTLRNEHLSYIVTWYSLCGATSYMWFIKFMK